MRMSRLLTAIACAGASSALAAPPYIARLALPVPGISYAAATDLDGDGIPDVAAVSASASQLYIYYGLGDGTFRFPPEIYPTDRIPLQLVFGDLVTGGTTLPDILVVTQAGTVANPTPNTVRGDLAIFENSGDPPGAPTPRFQQSCQDIFLDGTGGSNGNQPRAAALGDFDNDTRLDIAASSEAGNSFQTLYQGFTNSTGACRLPQVCGFGWTEVVNPAPDCRPQGTGGLNPTSLVAGSFLPKVHTQTDLVSLNLPRGGAAQVRYHFHLADNQRPFTNLGTQVFTIGDGVTTGLGSRQMSGADLNQDTVLDLLVADEDSGQVSVLVALNQDPNPPSVPIPPAFPPRSTEYPANAGAVWVETGEFAAGGVTSPAPDAVVANRTTDLMSMLPGRGDGSFYNPLFYPAGSTPVAVAVTDFNADSADDVVVANGGGGTASALLGRPAPGGFDLAYRRPSGGQAVAIAAGDWNGDTRLDAAVLNGDTLDVGTLVGLGDATFEVIAAHSPVPAEPIGLAAGRIDADGFDDLAVLSDLPGQVNVLLALGSGSLRTAGSFAVPDGARGLVAATLDAAVGADLAVALPSQSAVRVFSGNGDGTFASGNDVAGIGGTPVGLAAGDLDGANGTDLVVLLSPPGAVQLLRNDGSGGFTAGAAVATGAAGAAALAIGDIDGDSRPDVVVAHGDPAGSLVVLRGDGGGGLTPLAPLAVGGPLFHVTIGRMGGAGNSAGVLRSDSAAFLTIPWDGAATNLSLTGAIGYGTGPAPAGAVAAVFDDLSPSLDTVLVAHGALPSDGYSVTVLSSRPYDAYPPADAGPDQTICQGAGAVSIGTPAKPFLDYLWDPPTGLSAIDVAQPNASQSGTFTVRVTNPETGQEKTDTVTVTVAPAPTPTITPDPAVYCGGAPLVLDAGAGYASYLWSTGETSRTIAVAPSTDTDYSVDVTNAAGCAGNGTRRVTAGATPIPALSLDFETQCEAATGPTAFQADASGSVAPPGTTLNFAWSTVPPSPEWTISVSGPTDPTATVSVAASPTLRRVQLHLDVIAVPGGCLASIERTLEVFARGQAAGVGNTLKGVRIDPTTARLSWAPNGAGPYDVYRVTGKAAIPGMIVPANIVVPGVAAPPADVTETEALAFFQVSGNCPP